MYFVYAEGNSIRGEVGDLVCRRPVSWDDSRGLVVRRTSAREIDTY